MRLWAVGLSLAGIAAASPEPAVEDSLSFPDAVAVAMERNRDLERLVLSLESEMAGEAYARSDFEVKVTPSFAWRREDEGSLGEADLVASRKLAPGTVVEAGGGLRGREVREVPDVYRARVHAGVSQPLFRGAGVLATRDGMLKARQRARAARRAIELKKADLVVEIARLYAEMRRIEREILVDEAQAKTLEGLVRRARLQEKQGRGTRIDTLRVELQRGQAESRLTRNREALLSLRQDLANTLGLGLDPELRIGDMPVVSLEVPPYEVSCAIALEHRLDYAQTLDDLSETRRGVRIARRNMLPDVRVLARYERFGEAASAGAIGALDDSEWFVGLVASTDLDPRDQRYAHRRAVIDESTAEVYVAAARDFVRRQVYQQILAYRRALDEVGISAANLELARKRARLSRRLYEMGRTDNFTASNSEDEYREAENAYLRAEAEAGVAGFRLLRAMGTLVESPEDLRPSSEDNA